MTPVKVVVYTDGGARGNPGPAAFGVVIYNNKKEILKKFGKYLGTKTNNEAEYEGVIAALEEASLLGAREVEIRMDSELAVRQLNNIYKVKNFRMQELVLRVRKLELYFAKVTYKHIPREQNSRADEMVNQELDSHETNLQMIL